MSECGGLWKHENNQHALVPPKTECGYPRGGGIKNGHVRYPSYGGTQNERQKQNKFTAIYNGHDLKPQNQTNSLHNRKHRWLQLYIECLMKKKQWLTQNLSFQTLQHENRNLNITAGGWRKSSSMWRLPKLTCQHHLPWTRSGPPRAKIPSVVTIGWDTHVTYKVRWAYVLSPSP